MQSVVFTLFYLRVKMETNFKALGFKINETCFNAQLEQGDLSYTLYMNLSNILLFVVYKLIANVNEIILIRIYKNKTCKNRMQPHSKCT